MLLNILIGIYFISTISFILLTALAIYFSSSKKIKLGVICFIIGLVSMLGGGFSVHQISKIDKARSDIRQAQEIAAVQEYETEGKIRSDRAWWISLPAQQLEEKCRLIAGKIGKSWQEIVRLLSSKNAIILFDPQPEQAP